MRVSISLLFDIVMNMALIDGFILYHISFAMLINSQKELFPLFAHPIIMFSFE